MQIETAHGITVYYDLNLDDQLIAEGKAREFVNRIQRGRKEANFKLSDRIEIFYAAPEILAQSIARHAEYIKDETLAITIDGKLRDDSRYDYRASEEIDGEVVDFGLVRVG